MINATNAPLAQVMNNNIIAFETSCDDTCVAIYDYRQNKALCNLLYTQDHNRFGGIFPENASRDHMVNLPKLTQCALTDTHLTIDNIEAIAVTYAPGLLGSLIVGVQYAKSIAWSSKKYLIPVHHIEGHVLSAKYDCNLEFPYGCLVVSGGHTLLCIAHDLGKYEILGRSLDDAVGECFDKVARCIGLQQPGGPAIENLAQNIEPNIKLPIPLLHDNSLNFSLSGLKTAAIREFNGSNAAVVASSLQHTIALMLANKLSRAIDKFPDIKYWAIVGGVAANRYIFNHIKEYCKGVIFCSPSKKLCTDNALMIAYTAGQYVMKYGLEKYNINNALQLEAVSRMSIDNIVY